MRFLAYISLAVAISLLAAPAVAEHSWSVYRANVTCPNQARMIQLSPGQQASVPWVHCVWDAHPFQHVYSTDGGANWIGPVPIENPYPFANYYPTLNVPADGHPWVCSWSQTAFDPPRFGLLLGVWRDHSDPLDWHWAIEVSSDGGGVLSTVMSSTSGGTTGDPGGSVAVDGEPMVYAVTTISSQDNAYLMFFAFDTFGLYASTVLASTYHYWYDFHPTIDYSPGDIVHIAYQTPDGQIWYKTWSAPITPAQIRNNVPIPWYAPPACISQGLSAYNRNPSIDADGEKVYCSWRGPNGQGQDIGEVLRKWRYLSVWPPAWSPTTAPENLSNSPARESDQPQCGTGTTTTWQEQCVAPARTEVYAAFPGSGPVNISSSPGYNNTWPQNIVRNPVLPEPWVIRCYALWGQDALGAPYNHFAHYKLYSYIPMFASGLEYPTYLKAELGESDPSTYCVERTGYKTYGEMRVDFGLSRLVYVLPYLDPSHGYLMECILFNGEQTAITQRIEAGGVSMGRVTLKPGSCDTFRATLPRAAYRGTRAKVEVVRESGPFACLANAVKVYEKYEGSMGDGAQAGLAGPLLPDIVAVPNPFFGRCAFRFGTGVTTGTTASIWDASGRFVRNLAVRREATQGSVASWDGTDESGRQMPSGVYYCRAASGGRVSSAKVVRR